MSTNYQRTAAWLNACGKDEKARTMTLPEEIQEVRVLRLQPGDTLVLRSDHVLTPAQCENVAQAVKKFAPEGVKCMVLDSGLDMEVIRA